MWIKLKHIAAYMKPIGNHWFPFLVVYGGVCLLISGVGEGFGVPHLFRDDPELGRFAVTAYRNSPAFLTQAAAAFLAGILWTFSRLLEVSTDVRRDLWRYVLPRAAIFAGIPLIAATVIAPSGDMPKPELGELSRMVLGSLIGLALTWVFIYVGHRVASWSSNEKRWPIGQALIFLLVFLIFVITFVVLFHKLVPAISIFLLLGLVSAGYVMLQLVPRHWRIFGFVVLIILIIFGNRVPYKYQFPNFEAANEESYYDDGNRVELPDSRKPASATNYTKQQMARDRRAVDFLIEPLASLKAWRNPFADERPKLVVVATSGGAYRASFWTAIVLDALEAKSKEDGELRGFTANIRLITGASGGMVGAAYFVATRSKDRSELLLVELLENDTREAQRHTRLGTKFPIRRDSLSPVAQQLAQRDVLNTFLPWRQNTDRGRVLESQWLTLHESFSDLRQGELEGWRPSLILSPMLVETGQPLLISNLDLSSIRNAPLNEAVEFFRLFPRVHNTFRLQTAVRMNATFPYVSPAVSLPTEPARRVVDAGYYDNYGINLAVAYLREPGIRNWVQKKTSGVVIVQIRAFPIESVGDERGGDICKVYGADDKDRVNTDRGGAFQWLTSPIEGAAAARDASMVFRNNQELRALKDLYGSHFIKLVTFENAAKASMSWYLPGCELENMRRELSSKHNKEQFGKLSEFWNSASSEQ